MEDPNTTTISSVHLPLVEEHVREIFHNIPRIYRFHTLEHTLAVVDAVRIISIHEGLSLQQCLITEVSAWFHDVGYLRSLADHENLSAFRSLLFLSRLGIDLEDVEEIERCILVTRLGSEPKNGMQQVLCDADMWHLTCDEFWSWAERLRKEWVAMRGLNMTEAEWIENNIKFMGSVNFHTKYGRKVMKPLMDANIEKLKAML